MAGAGAGAAPIAPEEIAALAQLIGGGMVPGAPGPAGAPMGAPVDPMMGGAPAAGMGPIPGMPSTDPGMIAQLRAADHAALDAAQDAAMQQAAMMPGAAYAPGAGAAPPMDPLSLGAALPGMPPAVPDQPLPLPGSGVQALGGPDYGSMEGEDLAPLPGSDFAGL